jgi:hypothetical protein
MISCNKCCGISFIFNVVWHRFVVIFGFTQGLVVWKLCLDVVWHVGCVFVCGVVARGCLLVFLLN